MVLGENIFLTQNFSDVLTHYQQRKTNTSTCFLSDKPEVIINTEQTSRLCSVKKVVSGELVVYGFSTNLAKGDES